MSTTDPYTDSGSSPPNPMPPQALDALRTGPRNFRILATILRRMERFRPRIVHYDEVPFS
jgi:hypothetical protein